MSLVVVKSNAQLEEEAYAAEQDDVHSEAMVQGIVRHIDKHWEINRRHKETVEREMLEDLRQRNGEYDPDVLAQIRKIGGSEIFMQLTATKCRAALSWIIDILFPAGDKAWSIEPTPIPELPEDMKAYVQARVQNAAQTLQQQGVQPSEDDLQELGAKVSDRLLEQMSKEAKSRAKKHSKLIEDQMLDSCWEESMLDFLDDFVTFPAAIMKGPVYRRRPKLVWGPDGSPVVDNAVIATDERVSPFDAFPSPGARTPQEGTFIERMRMSRSALYDMIGVEGYDEAEIREVLEENKHGGLKEWDTGHESERKRTEETTSWADQEDELLTGLHFWGRAQGSLLEEWGLSVADPQAEYEVEAMRFGSHVVKLALNDDLLKRRPYHKACFQKKPNGFWGQSLPRLMRDVQRMCNATARALSNNMGMASGPQVVVLTDLLAAEEETTQMYPWKQWQGVSHPTGHNQAPVNFFQPSSNADELMRVYEYYEQKADDATNIPRYAYGNEKVAGAGQTAQGLAMLLESATKGIKQAIRQIDVNVIAPRITWQYQDNMLYEEDPSIKGDLQIRARGSSALIAKAAMQARRNEFLQITNNPVDQQLLGLEGRATLLRSLVHDMDMPTMVPSEEDIDKMVAQQAQQAPPPDPQVEIEKMRIESQIQMLQMKLQDAERDRGVKAQVAQLEYQGDMMDLASKRDMSLEQIKAQLGAAALKERGARQRLADEAKIKAIYGTGI